MDVIKEWFDNGCDFFSGVALYQKNSRINPNLLRMFSKETIISKEKLKHELQKLSETKIEVKTIEKMIVILPKTTTIIEVIETEFIEKQKKNTVFFHQLPAELQPELLKANQYWKENCLLKVQLNNLKPSQETEALEIQFKIADNWKVNALCWKKIDHYLEFRQLPKSELSKFGNFTPSQLLRRQQFHYQNISKMKKRLFENKNLFQSADKIGEKARLKRLIAKQNSDIIKKEDELTILTQLIDG